MKNLTLLIQVHKFTLTAALLLSVAASAQIKKTFTPRYDQTVKGNVTIIANNMVSRSATGSYTGSSDNHDFTDNVYVDIDSDNTTFNSSNANFANPDPSLSCLTIKKAFLYWAAADRETSSGGENQPSWNYNDIKIMLPGQTSYTTLTASQAAGEIIYRGKDELLHFDNDPYICVKDITAQVTALSNPYGIYQVANVEAKIGSLTSHSGGNTGTSGGWQIVFVYESPNMPRKNITLFDGYAHVTSSTNNFDVDFNGFQTIPTGNVNADIVIGSLEGDRSLSGDRLQIRNTSGNFVDITAPQRSASNFFNSRITIGNSDFTNRTPASTNTTGFDAAVFNLSNPNNSIITNNQTSATFRMTSNQETYGLYLLGLAVDVYSPDFDPIQLQISSGSNPVNPSAGMGFSFNIRNVGNDNAVNLSVSTTLPPQVAFVSASGLPAGVNYTHNPATGNLTFNFANGLADVGDPNLNINFQLMIKDQCYFLEDSCDLSFDLQFVASYNGVQNPSLQTTLSSSGVNNCNMGNLLPITVNINQPAAAVWATAPQDLDRTIDCNDTEALAQAQSLFPATDKCEFNLTKTSGSFVPDGGCGNTGTYTNAWVFTDTCGRTISQYEQVITMVSSGGLAFVEPLPQNSTVECTEVPTAPTLTATNSCGTANVTYSEVRTNGNCNSNYTLTRTWTVNDQCANSIEHVQTITVQDTTAPSFIGTLPPAFITVECDSVPLAETLEAIDNCSTTTVTFEEIRESSSCSQNYKLNRTWTATDECENQTVYYQIVTVLDTTPPTLTLPADITVECGDDTTPASTGTATGTDNCGSVTITYYDEFIASCGSAVSIKRNWTATDECNNTSTGFQNITVVDTTPPTLNIPADDTMECSINNRDSGTATGSDTCGNVTITFIDSVEEGCGNSTVTTRTWTATDDCGNSTSGDQIITITDTTPPTFNDPQTLPTDISVECDSVPVAASPTASDNCGATNVTFIETRTDGSCPSNYTLVRTWTATDECGFSTTHTQTITVQDTTAPSFIGTLPIDVTVECGNVPAIATLTATDSCGFATVSSTENRTDGSCPSNYTLVRTWTATDECGLTSIHTQNVTVQDTTNPVLTTPAQNVVAECDGSGNNGAIQTWLDNNGNAAATDSCGNITWTNNYNGAASDCSLPVSVTFTATDECGNSVSTTATYSIQDSTAPAITGGSSLTVQCDGAGNLTDLQAWLDSNAGATATDDCSAIAWSNNFSSLSDQCGATGSATVTFTATDACGNSANMNATFTIEDTNSPTLVAEASSLTVECNGAGNLTDLNNWLASNGGSTASDTCSNVTWSNNYASLSNECGATGSATVTFTATDDCGNSVSSSATFTIEDSTAPTLSSEAASLTVQCDGSGNASELNNWLASNGGASAEDTCSNVTWSNNFSSLSDECGATGAAMVTFTATDECGNVAMTTATFTIEDTTAPIISVQASNQTVECDGEGNLNELNNWLASNGGANASDSCSNITWTNNFASLTDECGATGSATVTFTATDDCGNVAITTATFTIEDNTAPVLDIAASNITIECDGSGNNNAIQNWLNNNGNASVSDLCSSEITWINDYNGAASDCNSPVLVTFTATDACGNSVSTTASYAIQDSTAPVLSDGTNIEVECDGSGNLTELQAWLNSNGGITGADDCSAISWSNDFSSLSDNCGATGSSTVTFTATDGCGNSSSLTATFTILDTTAPIIDTNALDLTVDCDGNGNPNELNMWLASNGGANASDSCSEVIWSNNFTSLSDGCGSTGSATVTFTATDGCGNTSSVEATFTIQDTTAPTFTVPADVTLECGQDTSDLAITGDVTDEADNCSGGPEATFTDSVAAGNCAGESTVTRTWTLSDECGNTTTLAQTITVLDTTAPTFTVPASVTLECDQDASDLALTGDVTDEADNCATGLEAIFTDSVAAGSCPNESTITRTWTLDDGCGNITTQTQTISIVDTTAPVISVAPQDVTIECSASGNNGTILDWLNSNGGAAATDNCSADVTWTNDYDGAQSDCSAPVTVTFTATDACGNSVSATATYSIQDTVAPTIDGGSDMAVECDGSGNAQQLSAWLASNAGATATDDCSAVIWSNNFTSLSDGCGSTGSATVTFTATDGCGNTSSVEATFTIQDTTAPTFTVPADVTLECGQDTSDLAITGDVTDGADNCSGGPEATFTDSVAAGNCAGESTITRTWTLSDECGNTTTLAQTITVLDTTAPTFTVPASVTLECDQDASDLALTGDVTDEADNCATGLEAIFTDSVAAGSCPNESTITRTWTLDDGCGNITTQTQTISIVDTTAPVISVAPQDVTIECSASGNNGTILDWLNSNGGAAATDNCSADVTWTNDYDGAQSDCSAPVTVTFTATDACGNSVSATATYSIQDTVAPTIGGGSDLTVDCDGSGNMDALNGWLASNAGATATDDCSAVTWSNNYSGLSDGCGSTGSATVTFTATDGCGNSSSVEATFTIQDTTPPTFTAPVGITLECDQDPSDLALTGDVTDEADNCSGGLEAAFTDSVAAGNCAGESTITRTWILSDECGNVTTQTQTISIIDTIAPTFTVPADLTIQCDEDPTDLTLTGDVIDEADNCSTGLQATYEDTTAPGSCANESIITRTWTLDDGCGNAATQTQTISVVDTTAPTFTVPADLTIQCDEDPTDLTLTGDVIDEADNCSTGLQATYEDTTAPGSCANESIITRTWTLDDGCGNITNQTQIINVIDTVAPVVVEDFEEVLNVNCSDIPEIPSLTFEDACTTSITVNGPEETIVGDINSNYQIIREWEVSDECGNTIVYTQTVNVSVQSATLTFTADALCTEDLAIDLFDIIGDVDTSGTWTVISGNTALNGSIFDPSQSETGDYIFNYSVAPEGECPTNYEVSINVNDDCVVLPCTEDDIIIPTTLTPNGDLKNDIFNIEVAGECDFRIELQIFNRWGAKIYENSNYQGDWDGYASKASIGNSDKVPTGTYYYIINIRNSGSGSLVFKPFAGPIYVATK